MAMEKRFSENYVRDAQLSNYWLTKRTNYKFPVMFAVCCWFFLHRRMIWCRKVKENLLKLTCIIRTYEINNFVTFADFLTRSKSCLFNRCVYFISLRVIGQRKIQIMQRNSYEITCTFYWMQFLIDLGVPPAFILWLRIVFCITYSVFIKFSLIKMHTCLLYMQQLLINSFTNAWNINVLVLKLTSLKKYLIVNKKINCKQRCKLLCRFYYFLLSFVLPFRMFYVGLYLISANYFLSSSC